MEGNRVKNLREKMIAKIISKMESGKLKWLRPWNNPGLQMPFNPVTRTRYKGINIAYLLTEAKDEGLIDPRWMTFAQARKRGFRVRGGSFGTRIEYWSSLDSVRAPGERETNIHNDEEVSDDGVEISPRKKPRCFCKVYTVFNGSQIEGLEPWENPSAETIENFQQNDRCEHIIKGCGVEVVYGAPFACYSFNPADPGHEWISMPNRKWFLNEAHFYATMLHEICHSTGNPFRMNRNLSHPPCSREYALEELRAEFASALLLMDIQLVLNDEGMEPHISQHAAYIQHWKEIANESPDAFARAIRDAYKIADLVLSYESLALEKTG